MYQPVPNSPLSPASTPIAAFPSPKVRRQRAPPINYSPSSPNPVPLLPDPADILSVDDDVLVNNIAAARQADVFPHQPDVYEDGRLGIVSPTISSKRIRRSDMSSEVSVASPHDFLDLYAAETDARWKENPLSKDLVLRAHENWLRNDESESRQPQYQQPRQRTGQQQQQQTSAQLVWPVQQLPESKVKEGFVPAARQAKIVRNVRLIRPYIGVSIPEVPVSSVYDVSPINRYDEGEMSPTEWHTAPKRAQDIPMTVFDNRYHNNNNNNNNNNNFNNNLGVSLHRVNGSNGSNVHHPQQHQNSKERTLFQPFEKGADIELILPESIYSAGIILPLAYSPTMPTAKKRMILFAVLTGWLLVFVNLFFQVTLTAYVYVVNHDSPFVCVNLQALNFLGSIVFAHFIFSDLLQSVDMVWWLYYVPTAKKFEPLVFTEHSHHKTWKSGLTRFHKLVSLVFIVLPKFGIAGAFLVSGIEFISRAELKQDVIIKTVATSFILELDEILFELFVAPETRTVLEELPSVRINVNEPRIISTMIFRPLITAAGVILSLIFVFAKVCGPLAIFKNETGASSGAE